MKEYEERTETIEQQKALIRERYKGINPDELDVIPALELRNHPCLRVQR